MNIEKLDVCLFIIMKTQHELINPKQHTKKPSCTK